MRLLASSEVPRARVVRTFRYPLLAHLVMLALFGGGPAVGLYLARPWEGLSDVHGAVLLVVAPVVLVMALLWVSLVCFIVHYIQGSLRRSNWVMKVTRDGVHLQFRSYSNWHFDGDAPTVVYLPLESIRSALKVVEWTGSAARRSTGSHSATTRVRPYLELHIQGLLTDELCRALARERERKGPKKSWLGMRTSSRSQHSPVLVPAAGVVRVDWRGSAMLRPFGKRSEILPALTLRVGCGSPAETGDDTLQEAA